MMDNIIKEKTCCFSGHRDISIYDKNISSKVTETVEKLIKEGYDTFIVGGALGFDMLCAIVIAHLKKSGEKIKLVYALPCYGYTKYWSEKLRALQTVLIEYADNVTMVSSQYDNNCMYKRNRYLVDRSSVCVCYMNMEKGGTAYTVRYAAKNGIRIINVNE